MLDPFWLIDADPDCPRSVHYGSWVSVMAQSNDESDTMCEGL